MFLYILSAEIVLYWENRLYQRGIGKATYIGYTGMAFCWGQYICQRQRQQTRTSSLYYFGAFIFYFY